VHYDHAGGLGDMQRLTGARVAPARTSGQGVRVRHVRPRRSQYGILPPIERLRTLEVIREGQVLKWLADRRGTSDAGPHAGWHQLVVAVVRGPPLLTSTTPTASIRFSADAFKYTTSPRG
jgi:hypothetical protein